MEKRLHDRLGGDLSDLSTGILLGQFAVFFSCWLLVSSTNDMPNQWSWLRS
jgi:hypothetical protein